MLVHNGRLYAGSGNWDWVKAWGQMPGFSPSKVHVYEYQGGREWRDLGQVGEGNRVMCMGSFAGDLYAGLDREAGGGKVFRHTDGDWIDCGAPDGLNVENLLPIGGVLNASTHGSIYRYGGETTWTCIGKDPHGINQIHSMAEIGGQLWIGTWPQGYVLRLERSGEWTNTGRLGIPEGLYECNEVMLEAGPTLSGAAIQAGIVDEVVIYIGPRFLGSDALPLFHLPGIQRMQDHIALHLSDMRMIGEDFCITIQKVTG